MLGPMLSFKTNRSQELRSEAMGEGALESHPKGLLSIWWRSNSARSQDAEMSNEMFHVAFVSFGGLALTYVDQGENFIRQGLS